MTVTTDTQARTSAGRGAGIVRVAVLVVLAAAMAAPAAAQLGLKKKLRGAVGAPAAADPAAHPVAAGGTGGTVVISEDVVDRLIAGMRAGQAVRDGAAKEDTPYGRYRRAQAAYAEAKPKCDAAGRTWPQRLVASQQLMEKNNALLEKIMDAMTKQDSALQQVYGDSMLAMQDPSCTVKEPVQPADWLNSQRDVDKRAEEAEIKVSGYDARELGSIRDRAVAILQDAPPPDVSSSEEQAVEKRSDELERLMGIAEVPAATQPAAAAAAPAPAQPPPPVSGLTSEQEALSACMAKNAQKHEKEIVRLGERVKGAYENGDTQAAMAIADSIRQLQTAGCPGS